MVRNVGPVGPSGDPAAPHPSDSERRWHDEGCIGPDKHVGYCITPSDSERTPRTDLLAACHDAYHAWSHYFDAEDRTDHWTPLCYAMDRLREAMYEAESERVSLDVERLARALESVSVAHLMFRTASNRRMEAEKIAAEYARLSPSTGKSDPTPNQDAGGIPYWPQEGEK